MTPDANDLCVFAAKRGNIEKRLDIKYNLPEYTEQVNRLKNTFGDRLKRLGDISDVICGPFGSAIKNTDYQDSGIPLVRITNITKDGYMDYSEIVFISEQLGDSLKRTQVSPGDIVVSQRGSLGQCAIVDDKYQKLNISANIIAIKNIRETSAAFARDYILSSFGQLQLERSTSGQVQQKITTQDIADILLPVGCNEKELVDRLEEKRKERKNKYSQAKDLLESFEAAIQKQYDLLERNKKKLCYAIRFTQLDGVIDAKRYMSNNGNDHLFLEDFCEIIDEKNNVLSYGNQMVDWIRIDDLPNNPIDIEMTRTVNATDMQGSFFEVQNGDILVARLGPTILNQKVVMVRNTERITLASAEFLVLRCKEGYNPEAVMAIIKTPYYRDLMYSYARGSTPSRYRLNREDALKLPFPDIHEKQDALANEATIVRERVKTLYQEAEQGWQVAKDEFEKVLLGK